AAPGPIGLAPPPAAPAPPTRERRPEVPAGLAAVLGRLLAKEPDDRFATPAEVAGVLRPFAEGCDLPKLLVSAGAATTSPDSPAAPVTPGPGTPRQPPPGRGTVRRRQVLLAALAVAVFSLTARAPPRS